MNLLCLNLQPPTAINCAVYGNFSGPKAQEIVVARGNSLDLLRPDENGRVQTVCSTPAFSIVRSLVIFRLAGANRDYVVIGSDSGKISVVEFDTTLSDWRVVHCEVFGKTGCRRIVPGQYLAADPKGRAVMVGAVEKQKFVYVLNRDSSNKLTISSPLEAHKADTIIFSICGVDVGYENPIFAMIELEYTEADQDPTGEALGEVDKKLSFYELDLGLNHVVRKWSEPISRTANFLLTVPGGENYPSGVLICGENWVSYKNQGHVEVRAALPRRHDLASNRGVLLTTGTLHKQKDMFFYILQSEFGDLYKVTLELADEGKTVRDIVVQVFDTIPLANNLCITRTGFLFAASEFSNHLLFQFQGLDPEGAVTSRKPSDALNEELGDDAASAARVAPIFTATDRLQNLLVVDEVRSLAPITDMLVEDLLGEEGKQLYTLVGRNNRSSLRTLRHGVSISELAISPLPGRPAAVWTLKKEWGDELDHLVVVSFTNATLVLSISDKVEEVTNSGFLTDVPTLQVALLVDNAMIQVHGMGIRHIRSHDRVSNWKSPNKRVVTKAAVNGRQVAVALQGGEIIYFELDETGTLVEMGSVDMGKEVSCLGLGAIPEGAARCMFLAVGYWDDSCQLLSLDPNDVLGRGTPMPLESRPTAIALVEMVKEVPVLDEKSQSKAATKSTNSMEQVKSLYLFVGQDRGVLSRVSVDQITGDISDPRHKFIGSRPVRLCPIHINGHAAMAALSSRTWLCYNQTNRYHVDPLCYESLEFLHDFTSEVCAHGLVAVAGNTLRILQIENLGQMFNQTSLPLRYTPRRMVQYPGSKDLVVIETDHNEVVQQPQPPLPPPPPRMGDGEDPYAQAQAQGEQEQEEEEDGSRVQIRTSAPAQSGHWASLIRIVDASVPAPVTRSVLELPANEAAFSITACRFLQHSEEVFLVVGTTVEHVLAPRRVNQSYINVYRRIEDRLHLYHRTEVEEVPYAMIEFQGKLLVGVGRCLRLYDLGKKKLLKKCENKSLPSHVVRLSAHGDRIYCADLSQSVFFVRYRKLDNVLAVFADDTLPRFVTCMAGVDHNTVACGDKFGNVFVLRLPEHANDDLASSGNLWDQATGAANKLDLVAHYYLADMPTFMQKTALKPGGREVLLVATVSGGIYALSTAASKEEANFYQLLEMFIRQETQALTHRDHLAFRSFYQPVKNVVDGMLCEKFMKLPHHKQTEFAETMDRAPAAVMKRLEDLLDMV